MNFKKRPKLNKVRALKKILLAILPGLMVAGLVFSANKIKNLFRKRVRLTGELKSIADLTMLNMSNFDGFGIYQNEFNSIIPAFHPKFIAFSSKFPDFWMLKWVSKLGKLFDFGFNLFSNFTGRRPNSFSALG